ncbi:MAG: RimJ/RimL family protein N-acetyltransferase, partial [Candidatus Azotimanducaceae bacterium]
NLGQIIAAADTPNQRSIRVLQKLGMSFRERRQWHGLDTMFYEISSEDYHV